MTCYISLTWESVGLSALMTLLLMIGCYPHVMSEAQRAPETLPEIRWYSGRTEILSCPLVRRHAGAQALAQLIFSKTEPLLGALTLLVEGEALHFGSASEDSARELSLVHRDVDPRQESAPVSAVSNAPGESAKAAGLVLDAPDLGLKVERERRHPCPVECDTAPGQWVHPVVKVHSLDWFVRILAKRNLGLGEAFLEGQFEMLRGSVHHLVAFFQVNELDRRIDLSLFEKGRLLKMYLEWRLQHSHNEDIADHYDVGDNIMVPMLGATGCYSCGYMESETDDLDRMQLNKMNLVFSKMRLQKGMRILDTGCGNGGMAVHAATAWGCEVEGFTNSFNMASLARRNAERNGVSDRVRIHHADFSQLERYPDNHFDAIYEVGVWEHLRFADYAKIMSECWRILKPSGRMLIHSMASHTRVHQRDAYIQKYIFRDSNQIRLHALLDEARKLDMYTADVENLGRHYYWTLWYWRKNLIEAFERDQSIDERSFRKQLYFLECGMSESRFGDGLLYQILLYRDARSYRKTWRVDGRVHETERGGIIDMPLSMQPSSSNEHLNNDSHAPDKFVAPVYQLPSLRHRAAALIDIVRSATHR